MIFRIIALAGAATLLVACRGETAQAQHTTSPPEQVSPKSERLAESKGEKKSEATKKFRLSKEQIRPLATGRGGAIASDRITVDGRPVGYMYRTAPHNKLDSGWAFLAGDESDAYMNDAKNHSIYDVNTIANYDPEIVPLLDAPIGSAFIRGPSGLVADPQGAPQW